MSVAEVLDRLQTEAEAYTESQDVEFPADAEAGAVIRQGDVYFVLSSPCAIPKDYVLAENPPPQIALGSTRGSRHVIRDLSTVDVYLPPDFGQRDDDLRGPFLAAKSRVDVDHAASVNPHHTVSFQPGQAVAIAYQKNLDVVLAAARRAAD